MEEKDISMVRRKLGKIRKTISGVVIGMRMNDGQQGTLLAGFGVKSTAPENEAVHRIVYTYTKVTYNTKCFEIM